MAALPKQTQEIFEALSRGRFICATGKTQRLYDIIREGDTLSVLAEFFAAIGFSLEQGDGFFYFSKKGEYSSDLEKKLLQFERYIDLMDFISHFDNKLLVGDVFTPIELAKECANNPILRQKIKSLTITKKDVNILNAMRDIIRELEKDSFVELVDEEEEKYQLLDSFQYLEQLIMHIQIIEDDESEDIK